MTKVHQNLISTKTVKKKKKKSTVTNVIVFVLKGYSRKLHFLAFMSEGCCHKWQFLYCDVP